MLSQAQPSTNPRLVKEADALTEAGYDVEVLCSQHVAWARVTDRELLATRRWRCNYIGDENPVSRQWHRLRHKVSKTLEPSFGLRRVVEAASGRNVPELSKAACDQDADIYIARHPGALAAAGLAARKRHAKLGYDAEDFESGHGLIQPEQIPVARQISAQQDRIAATLEREWLPHCDYITAGSPAIADAYAEQYSIARPTPILNVFPLRDRPQSLRSGRSGPLRLYWFSQTIGPDRGLQDALRAMAFIPECMIELHLRGEWARGFEHELRQLASSLRIAQERIIRHSPSPPDEMIRLAADFDVGLALEQPVSRNRLLCLTNKLFTYMLAGNAIAATVTPGQQPVLRTIGSAAISYVHGDIATLAAGLKRWHGDRTALERARQSSWQWGSDRYNWDLEKAYFLGVVQQALGTEERLGDECRVAVRA